ncbi:MAG: hypothetical protein ABIN68_00055 [Sphingomicrobium sp.]
MKALLFVTAVALAIEPALAKHDARGEDAVAVFGDLCVSLFTGEKKSEVDPTRFVFTKIGEKNAREIKPGVKGSLWDVSGTKSDVHMLLHYEPSGMCVVEVAEADEATVRLGFEQLVRQTATTLGSAAKREPDTRNRIEGKDATTSMWRINSSKGKVMLALTTYPDPKFMIQHLMTASFVK